MFKVFTAASLAFDHPPANAELVWLLGDRDHPGSILIEETSERLAARARLAPMKFVVPWMVGTAAVISAMPWITRGIGPSVMPFEGPLAWAMIATAWLAIVPGIIALLAATNRHFAKKGDYFRVSKTCRELELPQLGQTFGQGNIECFTELTRYYWTMGEADRTRQVSLLVRAGAGRFELYPVVREREFLIGRGSLADRLAAIFHVPVRRIELSRRESHALKDS